MVISVNKARHMMNAVMKMQGVSLNLYLFDQIFNLIFTCELLWHWTKYFCLDLNKEIMNYEYLKEKSFFSSVVDTYQCEIANGIWATTNVLNLQTQHLREANMTDWLIDLNIFPFLWWRTSLQMSRSECKINQKLSVRSIPGKIKYFVLFLVYFEGKHRKNCECYPCLFLSVSHLLSMLQLESLSH